MIPMAAELPEIQHEYVEILEDKEVEAAVSVVKDGKKLKMQS